MWSTCLCCPAADMHAHNPRVDTNLHGCVRRRELCWTRLEGMQSRCGAAHSLPAHGHGRCKGLSNHPCSLRSHPSCWPLPPDRDIQVLPVTDEMLYASVDEAVQVEETDWSQPRPEMWNQPCAWGAKRAVLFSGLR